MHRDTIKSPNEGHEAWPACLVLIADGGLASLLLQLLYIG